MADFNSKYSGEQVEALLDQVANGNADNAAQTYITHFDFLEIQNAINEGILNTNKDALIKAVKEGKLILIPFEKDGLYPSYLIAQAYVEDFLYMTIVESRDIWIIQTNQDGLRILPDEVYHLSLQERLESGSNIKTINGESILGSGDITVATMSEVNTAIANAITNVINADY